LVHDPKVLLLDEPASGLDPRARIELRELLKTLRDMGKTILISSHILSELGDMCNKIGIIERGVMLKAGDYRQILEEVQQERELRLVVIEGGDAAAAILEGAAGIQNISRSGNEFQMESKLAPQDMADLHTRLVTGGAKIVFFGAEQGTLEDVFLHVTKGGI
jgi:ABC-2 type transport system ATP-binding protein